MRFTIDSNVLVYALDTAQPKKRAIARRILLKGRFLDAILTAQALAEFLNVVRRKDLASFLQAREEADRLATLFPIAPTTWQVVAEAARFAQEYKLQLWDCVIWQAARSLGTSIFLTEDMQDGFAVEGMTVLNPFKPENSAKLATLLEEANDGE